jgi:hypothetical protein
MKERSGSEFAGMARKIFPVPSGKSEYLNLNKKSALDLSKYVLFEVIWRPCQAFFKYKAVFSQDLNPDYDYYVSTSNISPVLMSVILPEEYI